jgi:hypothetical protein
MARRRKIRATSRGRSATITQSIPDSNGAKQLRDERERRAVAVCVDSCWGVSEMDITALTGSTSAAGRSWFYFRLSIVRTDPSGSFID